MGQFKPMVKMMTTEPSVELKLKKGGKVEKKMQMGGAPAMAPAAPAMRTMGAPARGGMMGAQAPMKPSLMARRKAMRAMPAGAGPAGPAGMAGRMMKEGGESKAEHAAEMKKMSKTAAALKEHADKPASKAHKGLKKGGMACATGGVVNGQGGYKKGGKVKMAHGGIINTESQGGEYRNTKMNTAKPDHSPAKTGGVKMGNGGGYKKGGAACYATGGVAKSNAGGYKKGGKTKKMAEGGESKKAVDGVKSGTGTVTEVERQIVRKMTPKKSADSRDVQSNDVTPSGTPLNPEFLKDYLKAPHYKKGGKTHKYATGGSVNDEGQAKLMPQGEKRPARPVSINQLSGTYKKGGSVK